MLSVDGLVVDVSVELAVELVDVSVLNNVVPSKEVNQYVSPFTMGRQIHYLYFVPQSICR